VNGLHIAVYELVRLFRNRTEIVLNFGLPLLVIFILGSALSGVFGSNGEIKEIPAVKLGIVKQDEGLVVQGFESYLNSTEIKKHITPRILESRDQLLTQLRSGDIDYGLIIPSGFSAAVQSGLNAEWEFVLGKSLDRNVISQMLLQSFLDETNRIQSSVIVLGHDLAMPAIVSNEQADTAVKVRTGTLNTKSDSTSAVQYYAASMLIMFLLFSGMATAMSLILEREHHTLTRLNAMPIHSASILAGKLLGNLIAAMLQALVIITFSAWVYDVDWGAHWGYIILICFLTVLAAMCIALILTAWIHSTKAINTIYQTLIMVMTFLSGGMFPYLGDFLEKLGMFTINHWAADSIIRIMLNIDIHVVQQNITILGSIALSLLLIALISVWKVGYHE
jgi:ABC-2 type transport system permease protein